MSLSLISVVYLLKLLDRLSLIYILKCAMKTYNMSYYNISLTDNILSIILAHNCHKSDMLSSMPILSSSCLHNYYVELAESVLISLL